MLTFLNRCAEIIIAAGCIQGFFLAFLINSRKGWKKLSNLILSLLLIILSLSITHSLFIADSVEIIQRSPFKIKEPFILLIGPFMLFYIKELTTHSVKFSFKDLLHLIPFFLFFLISLPVYFHGESSFYSMLLFRNSMLFSTTAWILILVQYGFYFRRILSFTEIYRRKTETEFSNTEKIRLSWVNSFLAVFLAVFIVLVFVLGILIHQNNPVHINKIVAFTLTISIFVLGFKGFFQIDPFDELSSAENYQAKFELIQAPVQLSNKNGTLDLELPGGNSPYESNPELTEKILLYMQESKPFLKEDITLTGLAKELNLTRNQLSQVINTNFGDNFYNFINKYRVEEVKKYISDRSNDNYTFLAMAFQAGFPSKSSFNKIFKEFTGLTPTEFRKNIQ